MTNIENVPSVFNWVEARWKCSIQKLFDDLARVVESDVHIFNEQASKAGVHRTVKFKQICTRQFTVEVKPPQVTKDKTHASFMVSLNGSSIEFSKGALENVVFRAKPYLYTGECLLEINGEPHRLWQVSARAFMDFLFWGTGQ